MNHWSYVGHRFPFLEIRVVIHGQAIEIGALLDTGFDGDVVLPRRLLPAGAAADTRLRWRMADGSRVRASMYNGEVELGPVRLRPVAIVALGDMPMIGRRLIRHFRVTLDHGERVVVEP